MFKELRIVFVALTVFGFQNLFAQAPEPVAQPSNLQFGSVKTYSFIMSFTTVSADGYLILKSEQNITDVPVDGTTYEKGQGLSTCKVAYVGANSILTIKEVLENSTYNLKIFAYNGSGSNINYLQANPLSGSVSTPASDAGNYYQSVNPADANFIADLHSLINNHTMVAYVAYKSNIVPAIFERDTVGGQVVINCEYTNETTIYTPPFDFTAQAYNREHTLCKSWMQTATQFGANNLINYAEGADYYNLLLTRSTPNQARSNNPLGIVITTSNTYGEAKIGSDNLGNTVFEPKANRKGDAARAMMYEMVCYDGLSGGWGLNELLAQATEQDQNVLKLWNQQDPPDKFERTKNEYIHSIQNNRNPFIDHPEWVQCINFDSLVKAMSCIQLSVLNNSEDIFGVNIFPNPACHILNVELSNSPTVVNEILITDLNGREMMKLLSDNLHTQLNIVGFASGTYFVKITADGYAVTKRLVVFN